MAGRRRHIAALLYACIQSAFTLLSPPLLAAAEAKQYAPEV